MAEAGDDSQKTEEPTSRKLSQARERGQVAQSQEIKHLFVLVGALMLVGVFAPIASRHMVEGLYGFLSNLHRIRTDAGSLQQMLAQGIGDVTLVLAVPLIMFIVLAIAASVVQFGFLFQTESMKPELSKLNPLSGVKRLFSMRSLTELLKGIVKISIVAVAAFLVLRPEMGGLDSLPGTDAESIISRVWELSLHVLIAVTAVMAAVAMADFIYQKHTFLKQQRMTKQEVRDEHKQSEGDPLVKGRIRRIRMQRARKRMMAAVPTADVVVTNPTHFAIAMEYKPELMAAPKVVAKGVDHVAMKIRELAAEHGIAIVENPPLARALYRNVEVDEYIPPEHYKAVAEVISYVFKIQQRAMPRTR